MKLKITKCYLKIEENHTMLDFLNDKHARMHACMHACTHSAMLALMYIV